MPVNCPILPGDALQCISCRYRNGWNNDQCSENKYNPVQLKELMTAQEYIDFRFAIHGEHEPIQQPTLEHLQKQVDQLRALFLYLEKKYNEHIDQSKRKSVDFR
jgi:hypothetical protein